MHFNTAALLVVLYFLALSVRQGLSLKCYSCNGCPDPFDYNAYGSTEMDCRVACQKITTAGYVIRSCSVLGKKDSCEKKDGGMVCLCTSDLCNSALKTQTSARVILSTASLVLLRKYLF